MAASSESVNSPTSSCGMETKPVVILVLGRPGSGKGTLCKKIAKEFGFVHISIGDMLKEEGGSGSEYGNRILEHIRKKEMVATEITINILKKTMDGSATKNFIIDGLPATQENLTGWQEIEPTVDRRLILYFKCSEEVCKERCLHRGRKDDTDEILQMRFKQYLTDGEPIVNYYINQGAVMSIDSERNEDEVFEEVMKVFRDAGFELHKDDPETLK